jgi:peptidyl-prolyl cis-trans isomerase A (cyclophilin A)
MRCAIAALLMAVAASPEARAQSARGMVSIVITTDRGEITAELDSARAPITVTNFLRYVDEGRYSGGAFHRTVTTQNQPRDSVRIEVIQARARSSQRDSGYAPIPLERTNTTGLTHTDGTLSMARAAANTATSAFFITIGDQPSLDEGGARNPDRQGFAAFGRVTRGMDVVRTIQNAPHLEQNLTPPVVITGVRRLMLPSR